MGQRTACLPLHSADSAPLKHSCRLINANGHTKAPAGLRWQCPHCLVGQYWWTREEKETGPCELGRRWVSSHLASHQLGFNKASAEHPKAPRPPRPQYGLAPTWPEDSYSRPWSLFNLRTEFHSNFSGYTSCQNPWWLFPNWEFPWDSSS